MAACRASASALCIDSMKNSRRGILIVSLTIAGLAFAAVAWLRREKPIEIEAKDLAYAMWYGDIDAIYDYSMENERKLTGLTKDSLRALWSQLILPRYKGSKILGFMSDRSSSQGICQLILSHPKKAPKRIFVATLDETDHGRRCLVTVHLLTAWTAEYKTDPSTAHALLRGVEHDKAYLKQIGIKGLYSVDSGTGDDVFSTWDEYEARLKARVEAEKQGKTLPPYGSE